MSYIWSPTYNFATSDVPHAFVLVVIVIHIRCPHSLKFQSFLNYAIHYIPVFPTPPPTLSCETSKFVPVGLVDAQETISIYLPHPLWGLGCEAAVQSYYNGRVDLPSFKDVLRKNERTKSKLHIFNCDHELLT